MADRVAALAGEKTGGDITGTTIYCGRRNEQLSQLRQGRLNGPMFR